MKRFYKLFKVIINRFRKKNPYFNLSSWDYQKAVIEPVLKPDDIVLDIGSGNNPIPRANILADFYPDNNFHRSGNIVADRPLIICSLERLPFLSKSFDFVVCSHAMEHITSPYSAALELQRISKGGYIETPAYGKDILVGTGNMHKWQIVEFEGVLHFFEYSEKQKKMHVCSPMMDLWMRKSYHPWQDYFWKRQELFNACLLWKDSFNLVEHRRTRERCQEKKEWMQVPESSLPGIKCSLTEKEIDLLVGRLSTPDGLDKMYFKNGCFVNKESNIFYPVRGKKIYFELGI